MGFHSPLYSGLGSVGASHSPSSSSSQSSGLVALASGSLAGMSSQPSGFLSSGSGICGASTQSAGLDALGSLIFLGSRKSKSSPSAPDSTLAPSICTSYVFVGLTMSV